MNSTNLILRLSAYYAGVFLVLMCICYLLGYSSKALFLCILLAAVHCSIFLNIDDEKKRRFIGPLKDELIIRLRSNLFILPATIIVFAVLFIANIKSYGAGEYLKAVFIASISASFSFLLTALIIRKLDKKSRY